MSLQPAYFDLMLGLLQWSIIFASFIGIFFVVALATSFSIHGMAGPGRVFSGAARGFGEFLAPSPRRVMAIASLTFKESIRKKALLVFVVFAVLFMFGSWFLEGEEIRPDMQVRNYVAFVFISINWLVLPVILLLSCWGLPEDIRVRSLHTVVTKPVRRNEVVLGRMVGFIGVGTLILTVMSVVGYIWIQRVVSPDVPLFCRVPVYGEVSFVDRTGNPSNAGVNVGDIDVTRSFIEGGSKAAGIWTFPINEKPDKLRLESRFEAFRTFKGDMNRSLRVRYTIVNEEKSLRVPLTPFEVNEFGANEQEVDRKVEVRSEENLNEVVTYDLYDDLATPSDQATYGNLTIHVQCLDRSQFLGVSRGDFFIRMPDRTFLTGYSKAVLGVWLKIAVIVIAGVTASCFVKWPVATLLSSSVIVFGQVARGFLDKILAGKQAGGGAAESVYRLLTHMNDTSRMPEGMLTSSIKAFDYALQHGLFMVKHIIPDLTTFGMSEWIAHGFDVPWNGILLPSLAVTIGYFFPCLLLGYFSLSLRELEAK